MNILRYMLIMAYFEAIKLDEDDGLDYTPPVDFAKRLYAEVNKEIHKKDPDVDVTDGAYIQCDPGYLPPIGAVFDGIEKDSSGDFHDLQVMVETDKFGNINYLYWDKV